MFDVSVNLVTLSDASLLRRSDSLEVDQDWLTLQCLADDFGQKDEAPPNRDGGFLVLFWQLSMSVSPHRASQTNTRLSTNQRIS